MKKNYFITGFKVLALNLIAGVIIFVLNLLLGLIGIAGITAIGEATTIAMIFGIIFIVGIFVLAIYINGFIAQKLWKWR